MSTKYYISSISYDEATETLEIEWTIDVVWLFFNVPKERYSKLNKAEDKETNTKDELVEQEESTETKIEEDKNE